jgi:excisionase family DNA binding protein
VSRLLTVAEVAERLQVSEREVQRLALAGRLSGVYRVGRLYRFDEEQLLAGLSATGADQ